MIGLCLKQQHVAWSVKEAGRAGRRQGIQAGAEVVGQQTWERRDRHKHFCRIELIELYLITTDYGADGNQGARG